MSLRVRKATRQRFWICIVDEGGPPARHYYKKDAMKEAERLAKETDSDVFLLEAAEFVRHVPPTPPPIIEWNRTTI